MGDGNHGPGTPLHVLPFSTLLAGPAARERQGDDQTASAADFSNPPEHWQVRGGGAVELVFRGGTRASRTLRCPQRQLLFLPANCRERETEGTGAAVSATTGT